MGKLIKIEVGQVKKAQKELEVAENQFNWAIGYNIDAAIMKYNVALETYNNLIKQAK